MKRIPELSDLPEEMQKLGEIPDDCRVVNVTNKYHEGGPVVVSYERINPDPEVVARNRAALCSTIEDVIKHITGCDVEVTLMNA